LGYAIANTTNNKQNSSSIHFFFPSDSLIKKNKHTHKLNIIINIYIYIYIIIKTQNQNRHKRVQNLRIKNKLKTYIRESRT